MIKRGFRSGDYKVQCDVSGFLVNASDCRKQWDGLFVYKDFWSTRQPQDLLTTYPERLAPPNPRPPGTDEFISSTDITADDL